MERLVIKPSEETELAKFLHARVVGQNAAIATLVGQYNKWLAGMQDPSRTISNVLFLGPTGTGKTKLVESFCEFLFGEDASKNKPLVFNCAEYADEMSVSKLIGSGAGYTGSDQRPRLHKDVVEGRKAADGREVNVLLFDEVEKAATHGNKGNNQLMNVLLSIMDRGTANMAMGSQTSFKNTFIFFTSNLGSRELLEHDDDAGKAKASKEVAKRFFSPEQFNRIDETVVFNQLNPEQITLICDLEVVAVAERAQMEIELDDAVRDGIVKEGYDPAYGARELKRAVNKYLTFPLSSFMAAGDIKKGNRLRVEADKETGLLSFFKLEGMAMKEEEKTPVFKPPVITPEATKFRNQGYVRTMLDRKFKYGDSHGAKIYQLLKKSGFVPMTAEQVLRELEATGWKTENASPLAAIKYVLHDWTKKNWAEKDYLDKYQVKE